MKKRYLLSLIACFVGLCAFLFTVFYDEAEKTAIRQLNDQQQIHAKQAARGIEDFFTTWTGILNSFSKMDSMISADAGDEALPDERHAVVRATNKTNRVTRPI